MQLRKFARTLLVCGVAGVLGACAQAPKPMYNWQTYQPAVYAYLTQIDVALLDMIQQATGRGDQHLATGAQHDLLRRNVNAAEHHAGAQRHVFAVAPGVFGDLVGQLAGRRQDERAYRMTGWRHAMVGQRHQAMQDGQRERRGLAGTGLGRAHDVPAGDDGRNRLSLNRRRRGVAGFGNRLEQVRMQAQVREAQNGRRIAGRIARRGGINH